MMRAANKRTVAGVVTTGLLLIVSACAHTIPGTPSAAPGPRPPAVAAVAKPADLPYGRDRGLVDAWATMRTWDLCSIQDPTEAKNMLNGSGGSVVPYTDLSGCKVDVDVTNNTWSFRLDLSSGGHFDEKPTAVSVDGTRMNRYKDQHLGDCEYDLPYRSGTALTLTVSSVEKSEKSRTCTVAENYLHTVLPRMKQPPRIGTGASTPSMRLAGQDPCQGIAAVREDILRGHSTPDLLLNVQNPVQCEADLVEDGSGKTISYGLHFGLTYAEELSSGKKVNVDGYKGVEEKLSSDCQTTLDMGADPILLSNYGDRIVQIIEVTTPRCGQSGLIRRMLAPYRTALAADSVPPNRDAVRLGDLNPPASAKDVGAPFDPCTVVTWRDFPPDARDPDQPPSYLADINFNDQNVQTGCVFHGSRVVTTIAWGRDNLQTLQQRNAIGGRDITLDGRDATVETSKTDSGSDLCTNFVSAQQGTIAIASSENTQTGAHLPVCPVNNALLKVITRKVP